MTTRSTVAPASGSAVAIPLRHCTASAPGFARASARTSGSPSTPMTRAPRAASAMVSVPVPHPMSATQPSSGSPSRTWSRRRARNVVSRIVSAMAGSYRRVSARRPAAGT